MHQASFEVVRQDDISFDVLNSHVIVGVMQNLLHFSGRLSISANYNVVFYFPVVWVKKFCQEGQQKFVRKISTEQNVLFVCAWLVRKGGKA